MSTFKNITLEKGMYEAGNFGDVLERMDPSEQYCGTALDGLDAFSRQLKRYDIEISGSRSDTVEKFFMTSNSAVLFPEYVRRCVQTGIDENNAVQDLVANTIDIDGFAYRSVYATQYEEVPSLLGISSYDNLIPIQKHGRRLSASYESLRFQRISTLTSILQQIGCYITRCQYYAALELFSSSHHIGSRCADDILSSFSVRLGSAGGYRLTTLICTPSEFESLKKDANITIEFHDGFYCGDIKIINHMNQLDSRIVGIDNRYALEMIKCGPIHMDYEKLIDKRFENVEICQHSGFSILCPDAIATVELAHL